MKYHVTLALGASLLCAPAVLHAQEVPAQPAAEAAPVAQPAPVPAPVAAEPAAPRKLFIPAGLSIPLALGSELSSSRNKAGETFSMTVVSDVMAEGVVVIPRGTRAVGEITLRSGRGMFGKSGKMELAFRYLDVDGMRIPLKGDHWQAGDGNTAGTVGAVVAAGVIGGMVVTGRSANMKEGREFTATTLDALPLLVLDPRPGSFDRPIARLDPVYTPSAILTGSPKQQADARRKEEEKGRRRARRSRS